MAKLVMFRLLTYSVLSAISFKLVQDFLLRLFELTVFSTSIGVELFSGPAGFFNADRFLFLLLASNKVEPLLTNGVIGPSVVGTNGVTGPFVVGFSLAKAGEAISFVL